MAELFSLMPDSTSCKTVPVEASRTPFRPALPASFHADAPATRPSHQSNHQDTKAQRTDSFPRAARGNESSSYLDVFVFLGAFVVSLSYRVGPSKIEVPKRRQKRTHLGENASILKEFIF
ncbi:MAG: hypothetical protein WBE78_18295 [Candidatus Binataceae bacterium]